MRHTTLYRVSTRFIWHILLILGSFIMLYPLLWLFSSSFKPAASIQDMSLLPRSLTLDNYRAGWNALQYPFGLFLGNSLFVCIGAVAGNVLACSMAAYAFARLRFRLKRVWFALMLVTVMLPYHVLVVPQYILFLHLGWINTFLPLIVPKFLATDTFFIFLLVQFIRTIPRELDSAARIDGCNAFQLYWRIILPLSLPALATTAILTFIWTWSDFFTQLIFLNDQNTYTISIALRAFLDNSGNTEYGALFAMSVLSLIPIVAFFFLFQRFLISGIATTGIRG
ncbi:multiple sugar transport system permease protein [Thermosporothrix hazakensis]|uniref:Multiple sugar transport system permease protein n=1 Tax=Thermosporothrix hazakensis TaxID=644383 RepID=A0A326TZ16_THEHA|nr:carbohydrate ABC transporter permease [Thermosporothrix hazakensis]PZW22491.1 multiple sugar transport system permease protein [Thermosporothrix hazakensis]GCE50182.1 sugar ABC transporter permease [Thermosporothrix hazakensis]